MPHTHNTSIMDTPIFRRTAVITRSVLYHGLVLTLIVCTLCLYHRVFPQISRASTDPSCLLNTQELEFRVCHHYQAQNDRVFFWRAPYLKMSISHLISQSFECEFENSMECLGFGSVSTWLKREAGEPHVRSGH